MADEGMKELQGLLEADKDFVDRLMRVALKAKAFHNDNKDDIQFISNAFGKPLDNLTDAEIQAAFASKLTPSMMASARKFLVGFERLKLEFEPIKNEFPANDLTDA